ncbi:ATP-dependent Clp protease proteolytic subunit ClpP [Natranaerovirga hydrolytica]|uniref:ATP-dependent Clp protease proteolytic subunit ClpP n=1 Tax=Natranaerovirga hydrolytica TaxID=680378 RepID=A0A4R1MZB3_9FIRM|nr:ATP-dependent Clp protease proteolytic subunit [Natranaerovirga hydrolytica]TCK97950.1 ATP-dependent Clp protease proteolytic subunit ClpP [Natranaerovirga hydrolytica]
MKSEVNKDAIQNEQIKEFGQTTLSSQLKQKKIHLLTIVGQIEGHMTLPQQNKTTKYEHVLPQLASIEDNEEIEGLLILLNTVGGDVEAGLAISEMIASISKPTVSLVLGGSHSIGVPLAVSADYCYIVPSATMIIHPVRMNGTVIGISQAFEYFEKMQERIIEFITRNSNVSKDRLKSLMLDTGQLAKDVGSILVGMEAVQEGLINEIGGINDSIKKLYQLIELYKKNNPSKAVENNSNTNHSIETVPNNPGMIPPIIPQEAMPNQDPNGPLIQ